MSLLLSSQNVCDYLDSVGLWQKEQSADCIEQKTGKNFNLRVKVAGRDLLVKQEPPNSDGELLGDMLHEFWFYQMLAEMPATGMPALGQLRSHIIQPLHFDQNAATLVFPFLEHARDLSSYYDAFIGADSYAGQALPSAIAAAAGVAFAALHRDTFTVKKVKDFWMNRYYVGFNPEEQSALLRPDFLAGLQQLTPETFCLIPTNALKFFRFYQRHPQIGEALCELSQSFIPCCAVHHDPRFANLLWHEDSSLETTLQIIDWEKWRWGDPAYDLGQLLANYLKLWLESLPISKQLGLADALNMATVPLSAIQPSTYAFMQSYLSNFPKVLHHQPDFLIRTTRFIGLGLINQIQLCVSHKYPLGNVEMAMAQVGKSLLCQPESSIPTVFGQSRRMIEAAAYASDIHLSVKERV